MNVFLEQTTAHEPNPGLFLSYVWECFLQMNIYARFGGKKY